MPDGAAIPSLPRAARSSDAAFRDSAGQAGQREIPGDQKCYLGRRYTKPGLQAEKTKLTINTKNKYFFL